MSGADDSRLPTRAEIFANTKLALLRSLSGLDDAAAELRSDWRPIGAELTPAQATARRQVFAAIDAARRNVERVLRPLDRATGNGQ